MDDLLAPVGIELDLLLLVHPVVLLVAPARVVVVVGRVLGVEAQEVAREVREHRVGIDERRPAPDEHLVLALADHLGELAVVVALDARPDPMSSIQPLTNSEIGTAISDSVRIA